MKRAGFANHAANIRARTIDSAVTHDTKTPFRANADAWKFFQSRPPGYRHQATWWVISAKREETRARRLATLIADSAAGRTLRHLTLPAKR